MAYQCPRCGQAVARGSSSTAGIAGGLVGALLYSAFGGFQCKKCGTIPKKEFPPEVQSKMMVGSLLMVGAAVLLLVGVIVLVAVLQH